MTVLANGITDVRLKTPFCVAISNLRYSPMRIHDHTVVGIVLATTWILFLEVAPEGTPALEPGTIKNDDKPQWAEQIGMAEKYSEQKPDVIRRVQDFYSMSSRTLDNIQPTRHRTKILESVKPVHEPPYRSGHRN